MFQYAAQTRHATGNFRLRYKVLLITTVLLLVATVALAVVAISANSVVNRSRSQYAQAMSNNAANAISVANRSASRCSGKAAGTCRTTPSRRFTRTWIITKALYRAQKAPRWKSGSC